MALTLDDLINAPRKLKPFEVEITGIDEPVLIHSFTLDEMKAVEKSDDGGDQEVSVLRRVATLMRGPGADVSEADLEAIGRIFTGWQVREIYVKGMKLNGFGPDALREAEKN